jgi:hypothetical protein
VNDAGPTEFIPSAQWHTHAGSSASFYATGIRKAVVGRINPGQDREEKHILADCMES